MADINSQLTGVGRTKGVSHAGKDSDAASDHPLLEFVELLFFAYRDFTGDPDVILAQYGFGRAHHRVLHFVTRNPGIRVADLLDILKITKQSLGRVLRQLIDDGFVHQEMGRSDRRQRLLYPTEQGARLTRHLAKPQIDRIEQALKAARDGAAGDDAIRRFLTTMVNEAERTSVRTRTAPGGRR